MLKEVAGTTLYDEKKAESLKTLNAAGAELLISARHQACSTDAGSSIRTEIRRAKMTSTLENVDGRLRDLEEEMTELREFQEKERERKALEYAMYEGELEEITGTLGDVRYPASHASMPQSADRPLPPHPSRWRPSGIRR